MIKKSILLLFISFILCEVFAQTQIEKVYKARLDTAFKMGSKIETISLNQEQTSNLALLGKIWGFLKYHHPNVAAGDYNWDFELFRIIPKILAATKSSRDKILIQWIDSLGTIVPSEPLSCVISSDAKQKPDYSWISRKNMSDKLVLKLLYIKKSYSGLENYYVTIGKEAIPLYFTNEEGYNDRIYPDAGFRLLSLFRFWNIIQYYYPYKYTLKEELWENVIERFVPKFVEAKNVIEYHSALLSMLECAHDSHIVFYNDPIGSIEGASKPAIKVRFIENQAIVTDCSYMMDTLLKLGDIILEKNEEKIENVVQRMLPFTPASNRTIQLRTIGRDLLCTNNSSVKLRILRGDSTFNIFLPTVYYFRDVFASPNDNYTMLSEDIGYIYLGTTNVKQLPIIFDTFNKTKGIILDLRNYPMDFEMVYKLSVYLMPHSTSFAKLSRPSGCPGIFHFDEPLKVGIERTDYYRGKIVILVNEFTQSRAEFFAMAFKKAPSAVVLGSQTAGADGNFVSFLLPGGFQTGISGKGVYYPDGRETQRIGIVPDIEVNLTIKGIKEGRDEVLEKAIEYINKN